MNGAEKALPIGEITTFEKDLLKLAIRELKWNVERGVKFPVKFQD